MIATESQPGNLAPSSGTATDLRLRIHHGAQSGRLVDLSAGKTTIGSSPRCTICVRESGIQPLHCLIMVEGSQVTARAWVPDTLLNGQSFDDADLASGDILSIGPLDIEVIGEQIGDAPISRVPTTDSVVSFDLVPPPIDSALEDESHSGGGADSFLPPSQSFAEQVPGEDGPGPAPEDATWLESSDEPAADSGRSAFGPDDFGPAVEYHVPTMEEWEWAASENARLSDEIMQLIDAQERLVRELTAVAEETTNLLNRLDETEKRQATAAADDAIFQAQLQEWKHSLEDFDERVEDLEQSLASVVQQGLDTQAMSNSSDATAFVRRETASDAVCAERTVSAGPADPSIAMTSISAAAHAGEAASDADDAIAHLRELSIWKAESAPNSDEAPVHSLVSCSTTQPNSDERSTPVAERASRTESRVHEERQAASAPETQSSFIERYAHLFANDDANTETPPSSAPPQPVDQRQLTNGTKPAVPSAGAPTSSAKEDEESIEAYMSKLLQRVRGETVRPTLAADSFTAHAGRMGNAPGFAPTAATGPLPSPDYFAADGTSAALMTNIDQMKRRGPAPEKTTNLEALRALANQTARRAIGAHASRTHRRHAMTKFIVAMLAGTTSLWLMLEAPDWRDLQFISACVSLMAAAYWAGQTYGSFMESVRAGAYGHLESEEAGKDSFDAPLPIDVDAR